MSLNAGPLCCKVTVLTTTPRFKMWESCDYKASRCRWSVRRQKIAILFGNGVVCPCGTFSIVLYVCYLFLLSYYVYFIPAQLLWSTHNYVVHANDSKGLFCSMSSKTIERNDRTPSQ